MQQFIRERGSKLRNFSNNMSSDAFLGLPTNVPSYALVLMMVASVTGLHPGNLVVVLGNAHIYKNHAKQVLELLSRTSPDTAPLVKIDSSVKDIESFRPEHFDLKDYYPLPPIKAPVAV